MNWLTLLDPNRLGCPPGKRGVNADARTDFQRDYDRIAFSSAFRRLQGKTQVFPLPESDMTHTRLTHSLEASCVGRSLGREVGGLLLAAGHELESVDVDSFSAVIAAACLAHDIGNPPFGHSGEAAIAEFFEHEPGRSYLAQLTHPEKAELLAFEGNALGFRLLCNQKPMQTSNPGGFGLTHATLGAFSKYPCTAVQTSPSAGVSCKKFGIFTDDLPSFEAVAQALPPQSTAKQSRRAPR